MGYGPRVYAPPSLERARPGRVAGAGWVPYALPCAEYCCVPRLPAAGWQVQPAHVYKEVYGYATRVGVRSAGCARFRVPHGRAPLSEGESACVQLGWWAFGWGYVV